MAKSELLFFRADAETAEKLDKIAQAQDRSRSAVIRIAVDYYLDRVAPSDASDDGSDVALASIAPKNGFVTSS